MSSADVVIIGGGVNGASIAFNLARLGVRRVALLERRHLGAGASGKSGSLVRMHYTNEAESRLAWESLRVFRDFAAEVGGDSGVETSRGRVAAPVVVAVPGAWAGRLLDPLDLDFGLTPYRIQVSIFRWPDGFTRRHPAVIDSTRSAWIRPEGNGCTLIGVELGAGHADPDKYDEGVDEAYVALCREALATRFPAFERSTMRGGWAGMIMMSPDGRPIIDQIPSVPGLFVMLGDSGTSFKTSPAIGRCVAEWIVKGKPETADLSRFRSTRFAEGQPWIDATDYWIERPTISR